MNKDTAITLRQLISASLSILPKQTDILTSLEMQADAKGILDTPFSGFVLDSRELNKQSGQSNENKFCFVLLKSHTQPIAKSVDYAKSASKQVAFILSELDIEDELTAQTNTEEKSRIIENAGCPLLIVPNLRDFLGKFIQLSLLPADLLDDKTNVNSKKDSIAKVIADYPKVVGITGTNGKTTISQLVAQLCQLSNHSELQNSAVMGTAGNGRLDNLIQASHTTGDVLAVQTFLRQMATQDIDVLALEASSHGLDQKRLQGVPIKVAIYTNLSRDHLDYHTDMEDYARAKARLFDINEFPELTHAIINNDDAYAPIMTETAQRSGLTVWTYSLKDTSDNDSRATFMATDIYPTLTGATIHLKTDFGDVELDSPLLGLFNVANLLAAIGGVMALGVQLPDIPKLVPQLKGASGRMQRVVPEMTLKVQSSKRQSSNLHASKSQESKSQATTSQTANSQTTSPQSSNAQTTTSKPHATFIVDYAHTPDALTQVLNSLKRHCEGNLWAVFGCGGDRDSGKRPLMAQAGLAGADKVILTSDNPRSEDPLQILEDMQQGMSDAQKDKTWVIADRREAIYQAVRQAEANDIVVIAGKGHETYQEIKGVRYDFDDSQVLQEAFNQAF